MVAVVDGPRRTVVPVTPVTVVGVVTLVAGLVDVVESVAVVDVEGAVEVEVEVVAVSS